MVKHSVAGRVLFTADCHFGHLNEARRRGFADAGTHDRTLIENWNAVVGLDDTIYVVGDFAYRCTTDYARTVFQHLRGRKVLVLGNHDELGRQISNWAEPPEHRKFVSVDGQELLLDHYAARTWLKSSHGSVQLYGHSHGRMPGNNRQLDVGGDCWDFCPTTWPQIRARLDELPKFTDMVTGELDDTAEGDNDEPVVKP